MWTCDINLLRKTILSKMTLLAFENLHQSNFIIFFFLFRSKFFKIVLRKEMIPSHKQIKVRSMYGRTSRTLHDQHRKCQKIGYIYFVNLFTWIASTSGMTNSYSYIISCNGKCYSNTIENILSCRLILKNKYEQLISNVLVSFVINYNV